MNQGINYIFNNLILLNNNYLENRLSIIYQFKLTINEFNIQSINQTPNLTSKHSTNQPTNQSVHYSQHYLPKYPHCCDIYCYGFACLPVLVLAPIK